MGEGVGFGEGGATVHFVPVVASQFQHAQSDQTVPVESSKGGADVGARNAQIGGGERRGGCHCGEGVRDVLDEQFRAVNNNDQVAQLH